MTKDKTNEEIDKIDLWMWVVMLKGGDLGEHFLTKLRKFYRRARSRVPETCECVRGI
jgi:hypothetical protein